MANPTWSRRAHGRKKLGHADKGSSRDSSMGKDIRKGGRFGAGGR